MGHKNLSPQITSGYSLHRTTEARLVSRSTWSRAVFSAVLYSYPPPSRITRDALRPPFTSPSLACSPTWSTFWVLVQCGFKGLLHSPQTALSPRPGNHHIQVPKLQKEETNLIFQSKQREWSVLLGEALLEEMHRTGERTPGPRKAQTLPGNPWAPLFLLPSKL